MSLKGSFHFQGSWRAGLWAPGFGSGFRRVVQKVSGTALSELGLVAIEASVICNSSLRSGNCVRN